MNCLIDIDQSARNCLSLFFYYYSWLSFNLWWWGGWKGNPSRPTQWLNDSTPFCFTLIDPHQRIVSSYRFVHALANVNGSVKQRHEASSSASRPLIVAQLAVLQSLAKL